MQVIDRTAFGVSSTPSDQPASNTSASIKDRYAATGLAWWPVLLFLPARLVFSFLVQVLATGLAALGGSSHP